MTSKPVIYLLPGLLCDKNVWSFQHKALASQAEVRIPDFTGLDSLTAMAEKVLEEAPEKFSIAGHSMGGRVALEIIHIAPDRVEKLILISVGAHPVNDEECEQRSSLVEEAASIGMQRYAASWADLMLSYQDKQNKSAWACIETMASHQTLDNFIAHITAGLGRKDQSQYLPEIKISVLLIVGKKDSWSPVTQHEAIRQQIPDARLEIVADAGHMVILDQPAAVYALMSEWFFS